MNVYKSELIVFCLILFSFVRPQDINGQVTLWGNHAVLDGKSASEYGGRFLPELKFAEIPRLKNTDAFLVINTSFQFNHDGDGNNQRADLDLHRLWFRYMTDQSELSIGLQKINFGPARLLRALQWFDTLDPQDPSGFTDGVYGLRYRYNTLSNMGVWAWVLFFNQNIHGIDKAATYRNTAEYGGRIILPLLSGEFGITTHHRQLNTHNYAPALDIHPFPDKVWENRLAVDGIWDIGVGVWFESVLIHAELPESDYAWQSLTTLGSDYTFPYGNGVGITLEHLQRTWGEDLFQGVNQQDISEMLLSYPLGILDQLQLFLISYWDENALIAFLSWQRTWDQFLLRTSLLAGSGLDGFFSGSGGSANLGDYGIQFQLNYHF